LKDKNEGWHKKLKKARMTDEKQSKALNGTAASNERE
jgi:hypothetical protein